MIKQSMICVALASMALATSCSQDDMANSYALSNSPIKMNTSFKLPTRAVETTISNLGSFSANAFLTGQSNYMTDVKYTSTDGSAWTTTAGTFFWPVSGDLHIYCYAPDQPGQSGTYTINKDRQTLADFTPNTAAADQKDFVYAKSTGNNAQNGSTGIDIDFQHALSEITIAAKNSNTAYTVEVTGVKLGNIVNKGTFTFPSVSDAAATWTLSSSASDKQDYTTTWSSPFTLGGDAATMDAVNVPFMIIPQQLEKADKASEKAYIAVKVKITMQGGQIIHNDWAYVGIDTNWEMGKRYAYTLDFSTGAGQDKDGNPIISGTAVKYNCSVTPWNEIKGDADLSAPHLVGIHNANSVIINSQKDWYGIDISRANIFWSSSEGNITNIIGPSTEWEAEVIWQDIPSRAINFCTESGEIIGDDIISGIGVKPFYVKAVSNMEGNIVVGVKKKGASDYLWSWHLWLTNYNPSIKTSWTKDQYIYAVKSGEVYRFSNNTWENRYKNKYIMDRNIGALSANITDGISQTRGLYYQFGRKDPFSSRKVLYNINGYTIRNKGIVGSYKLVSFAKAVNCPDSIFQAPNDNYLDWTISNKYASKEWNDITESMGKTFFDPCPEGWRLPDKEVWSELFLATWNLIEGGRGLYLNGIGSSLAYFPYSGRYTQNWNEVNNSFYCWSTSPKENDSEGVYCNLISSSSISSSPRISSTCRDYLLPVRCIQE